MFVGFFWDLVVGILLIKFVRVPIEDRFVEIREKVTFAQESFETAIVRYMPEQRYGLSISRRKM